MKQHTEEMHKSPDELEREIDDTRSQLDYTLDALRNRLSPGELADQALDYWRHGPKEYASELGANLSHSVRDNPLAVGLVGVGLAWLIMGGRRTGDEHEEHDYAGYGDGMTGAVREPVVVHAERDAGDSDAGDSKWRAAKEKLAAAAETVGDAAANVRDVAQEKLRRAEHGISATAKKAGEHGRDYRDRTKRQMSRARDRASDLFSDHPLVVGALGLAAGTLLAAAIPASRQEDELLGAASDRATDAARSQAEEGLDTAKRAVHAAQAQARNEAEQQGLTPEAAEDAIDETATKVKRVVRAAGEAVKEEVRSGGETANEGASPNLHH